MKFFTIVKNESERLPRKNFLDLAGKPLWRHTVDRFSEFEVFINTDSEELLTQPPSNLRESVNIYPRSAKHIAWEQASINRGSPVNDMMAEFFTRFVADENEPVVLFHVTSPFLKLETAVAAAQELKAFQSVHSVQTVQDFAWMKKGVDYKALNFRENLVQRTQDLDPILLSRGAFFITTRKGFQQNNRRDARPRLLLDIGPVEGIEIDNAADFELATLVADGLRAYETN